jgi:RNA polymerase sigma-70 factor (ECF subfamily)
MVVGGVVVIENVDVDQDLVERIKSAPDGDTRAFEALVDRYKERVVGNCRYLMRSASDAEDLAQEVFVKVFFAIPKFEGRSTFKTWIQRIKVNHTLNHMKKQQGKTFVNVDDPGVAASEHLSVGPMAERKAASVEARELIGVTLDSLSDALRVPLILRDMDHLSYQEIADTLGLGLSAVKMRIKRARQEFRTTYQAYEQRPSPPGKAGEI